ncbi:hypothetical protein RP20_CCG027546 [Aedes albopictus]|nr:hypothetical protein RP20_CCG027546 [Aedes albopictus]
MASVIHSKQQTNALGIICLKADYSSDVPRELLTTNPADMRRGTGGRSSFNGVVATVFGATGFLGRYASNKLGKTSSLIPYRANDYEAFRLKLVSDLGQVLFTPYHLCDDESIYKAVMHLNVVIYLVGRELELYPAVEADSDQGGQHAPQERVPRRGFPRDRHLPSGGHLWTCRSLPSLLRSSVVPSVSWNAALVQVREDRQATGPLLGRGPGYR